MIAANGQANQKTDAGREFLEWVSHLDGGIFVILKVYADESGTHHQEGKVPGSEVPVVGGYITTSDNWEKFCRDWKTILDRYSVPSFHAREFYKGTKHFSSWNHITATNFKYALAEVAGRNVPISGAYHVKEHHALYPKDETYPFAYTISRFFSDLREVLLERNWLNEKIVIMFDINSGKKWNIAITEQIELLKKSGIKIGPHAYGDDEQILPLQAADMLSHRARIQYVQKLEQQLELKNQTSIDTDVRVDATVFDIMLYRNLRPQIGFNPVITETLSKEIAELVPKYSSVKRALMEVPNNYFKINEKRKRKK